MQVLLTGASGFVGGHVARELNDAGHTVHRLDQVQSPESDVDFTVDIRKADEMEQVITALTPDACIHLAGIAFVPTGWINPELVMSVNLGGTVNLLEACRKHSPETRILVISSSEVYGREPSNTPLLESAPLAPANPYAVSKMGADLTTLLYARRYDMTVMTARPDNHIGPGQSTDFVAPAFAAQLVDMALGRAKKKMHVGNLESERDFMDVRDVARAYRLLVEGGTSGHAYNIASGRPVKIQKLLDGLCEIAGVAPEVEIDPKRYRPADSLPALNTTAIRDDVGWQPEWKLTDTLRDIYNNILKQRQ